MRNSITIILLLGMLGISCNKLDIKPKQSQVVPQTLKDFQGLADNVNIINNNLCVLGEVAADNYYISDANYASIAAIEQRNAYIWNKKTFEGLTFNGDWNTNYQRIFYANVILDGMEKLDSSNEASTYKNVKGQALFIRSYTHYTLAELFTKPYNPTTAATDLGLILRLTSDLNVPSKRSTLQVSFDRIISDLELAKELLPTIQPYKTRPNKAAAYALLARIYLAIGDYSKAYFNADECLKLYGALLNYNSISVTPSFPFAQLNAEVIYHATLISAAPMIQARCIIEPSLYSSYELNDLRKTLFFKDNGNGTYSFKGNYNATDLPLFSGLATDETLLIRAESHVRLGRRSDGLSDLNSLLINRFRTGTFIAKTATSDDEALALILSERRKELLFRGLRWSDLRRLNKDLRFAITLSRNVNNVTYTLAPNDSRYTFPIPDYIIALNGVEQNP